MPPSPAVAARPPATAGPAGKQVHGRWWRWAAFEPPLRDPDSPLQARRRVWCRACGAQLGESDDPVDAVLLAWRSRRHMKKTVGGQS